MQGVEDAVLEHFEGDVAIGSEGIREIYLIEAKSSAFQFRIKKSENNKEDRRLLVTET